MAELRFETFRLLYGLYIVMFCLKLVGLRFIYGLSSGSTTLLLFFLSSIELAAVKKKFSVLDWLPIVS